MNNVAYESFIGAGETEPDRDAKLYRYLSTDAFLSLLGLKKIWLRQVTKWDDAREGMRQEFKKVQYPDHEFSDKSLDEYFGSCWSLQDDDPRLYSTDEERIIANKEIAEFGSDAMWRAYCPSGGVRIRTTQDKLKALFLGGLPNGKLFGGRVHYDAFGSDWGKTFRSPYLAGLFHKHIPFRTESEYRFIFTPDEKIIDAHVGAMIEDKFDFIDEVLVSPATKDLKYRSHALVRLALGSIKMERGKINWKDGQQFCRISQLYDPIGFSI
ncbi:MAG: DUF2971 domain-containing protein [Sulfuricella sp.]